LYNFKPDLPVVPKAKLNSGQRKSEATAHSRDCKCLVKLGKDANAHIRPPQYLLYRRTGNSPKLSLVGEQQYSNLVSASNDEHASQSFFRRAISIFNLETTYSYHVARLRTEAWIFTVDSLFMLVPLLLLLLLQESFLLCLHARHTQSPTFVPSQSHFLQHLPMANAIVPCV
jgi:hypothetical protein